MTKLIKKLSLFLCIYLSAGMNELLAQCAMCRASVESNVNVDGIGFAAKLNIGILYLFVTPYLLAVIIGYLWYRKSKENQQLQEDAANRKSRIINLDNR